MNKPIKHYSWAFGSFYIVNRYARLHKYLKEKKKKKHKSITGTKKKILGAVEIIWSIKNWDLNNCENIVITISVVTFSRNIYF